MKQNPENLQSEASFKKLQKQNVDAAFKQESWNWTLFLSVAELGACTKNMSSRACSMRCYVSWLTWWFRQVHHITQYEIFLLYLQEMTAPLQLITIKHKLPCTAMTKNCDSTGTILKKRYRHDFKKVPSALVQKSTAIQIAVLSTSASSLLYNMAGTTLYTLTSEPDLFRLIKALCLKSELYTKNCISKSGPERLGFLSDWGY